MISLSLSKLRLSIINIAAALIAAVSLTACDSVIYDDLDPCPQGLVLRFVYDYNMEFANAFPSQVSCLTVNFYDAQGRYVTTRTETSSVLADENWRMTVDLDPGQYTIIAYGGIQCDQASFAYTSTPSPSSTLTDLSLVLKPELLTQPLGQPLHHLFYGRLDIEVLESDTEYRQATVPMLKDTNNLRILLQNIDGTPVIDTDYNYTLTAKNTHLDWQNNLLPVPTVTYMPWARGQAEAGTIDGTAPNLLAYAEFSSSRFVDGSPLTLTITRASDGQTVLSIPLIRYLLLLKSQEFAQMGSQEFLDRESRWNLIFFLDSADHWINTSIIINDWVVRINDIDL